MLPWERRLRDLSQLLKNCGATYFSPDLFRQNTNQFLQTSRTVTFIIQKNKSLIPNFDAWYRESVVKRWANDPVMSWAKDARNVIEKEGDLEMNSILRIALLYSYQSSEDLIIETTQQDLLKASIDRLLQFAQAGLSEAKAHVSVLKIQRRWVANTLPDRELIYAFTYAYSEHFRVCSALAKHLNSEIDSTVPHPTEMDPAVNDVGRIRFIKTNRPGIGSHRNIHVKADPEYRPPTALINLKAELAAAPPPDSLSALLAFHGNMAQAIFRLNGNHIPMLYLYDKDWRIIDVVSSIFSDQSDKYLFWRNAADRATYLKAFSMVWICESWLRSLKEQKGRLMRDLPIVGEQLHVVAADAIGGRAVAAWNINRSVDATSPILELVEPNDAPRTPGQIFFIKPVVDAMRTVHGRPGL